MKKTMIALLACLAMGSAPALANAGGVPAMNKVKTFPTQSSCEFSGPVNMFIPCSSANAIR